MHVQSFNTSEAELLEEFGTQNYKRLVHRRTRGRTDRQANFSIPSKIFVLQGYNNLDNSEAILLYSKLNSLPHNHDFNDLI